MNTQDVIESASAHLKNLNGHVFDILTVSKPGTAEQATNLAKIISKLSPLVGNLIEFNTVDFLNDQSEYRELGTWERQDPGFPDTVFNGSVEPTPGFEIKAWFPLATEITARFKDSQDHFTQDQTYVCLLAWLPEHVIFGKLSIVDVCIVSAQSVAEARDKHYHNPPDYLVMEPEDTTARTRNLQQTNTNGYKFQGTSQQLDNARGIVAGWGGKPNCYQTSTQYQSKVRQLMGLFPYRLDTNYAKMDRIVHSEIESFKGRVLKRQFHGLTIGDWNRRLYTKSTKESALTARREALESLITNY